MKMKTVSLLAGASVPLILAGSASAEFIGLQTISKFVDPADIAADIFIPVITSLLVVNVYAEFTPGDAAALVIGAGGSIPLGIPLEINTRDGTFFQHPAGAATHKSPSAALANMPGFNTLRHDSFVTIGRKLDNDLVFGPDQTGIQHLSDWGNTRLTGHPHFETVWFVAFFPPQGQPGAAPDNPPDQVLIGQFTVANPGPNGGVFGSMLVNGFHTNAQGVVQDFIIEGFFDTQLPCPWDLDGDGQVNVPDLLLLLADFGSCDGSPADFDDDGCVTVVDLLALIANFGPCPGSECVWDVNDDGVVDQSDLQQVLDNFGLCDGCPEDVNGDGMVNGQDAAAVATHFGACP